MIPNAIFTIIKLTASHDLTYHTLHVQYKHMIHSSMLHSTTKQEGVVRINLSKGECPSWWGSIRTIYLSPTTCKKLKLVTNETACDIITCCDITTCCFYLPSVKYLYSNGNKCVQSSLSSWLTLVVTIATH